MRAIIIDDERLALIQLEKILKEQANIEIIGAFLEPNQALEAAIQLQPDVAFLDIHMPEVTGIQLAEMLQEACPELDIVFVTAFDEYALQAFDLNAVDYVMKPIKRNRMKDTVQRLEKRREHVQRLNATQSPFLVRCFQTLRIDLPGEKRDLVKWRTSKAQEVFAYLVHHRGQFVRKSVLHEMLWPQFDENKAKTHLYTTIYQIRQCLKKEAIDIPIQTIAMEDAYMIQADAVSVDAVEWERTLTELEPISESTLAGHQRVIDAYQGDYLGEYDYLWAEHERQRLRMLWLNQTQQVADYYILHGMHKEAMSMYQRIQAQQPYNEESYFSLMMLYAEVGDRVAVEEQYHRLTVLLEEELGVAPRASIVAWYDQWEC
ncbi:response regulator [Paenibacillus sp. SYP-B3998]|uniref:Response regulator n=1 Tax=Paenibacillus sp. SYP-B3998 TaxID=2678564 RepID=A0A6G4A0Z2_9BACL|nr:response regulator [Paenibacillus sp. SYP-B3998]NEW08010.1 response regulator [Paenibacillus sp. SYP-B3998]